MTMEAVDNAAILALARPDIVALAPYEHAVYAPNLERLHANELPWPPLSARPTSFSKSQSAT